MSKKKPGQKGKYNDWLTEDALKRLEGWARDGLTDKQIYTNMGIYMGTYYKWMNQFPQMKEAIKRGKAPVDFEVENALLKRALGFENEEVVEEAHQLPDGDIRKHRKVTKKYYPPDTAAIIFWLKNRKPEIWRDRREVIADLQEPEEKAEPVNVIIDI